jgi:hypothetical protein
MKGNIFIPPNGFVGAASQSAAVRNGINVSLGRGRASGGVRIGKRRRARVVARPAKRRASKKSRSSSRVSRTAARLVAGSAAAKAWGAKMRRLRKKK